MASLYKRKDSPYFWIKYHVPGQPPVQKSTGFKIDVSHDIRRARRLEAEKSLEEVSVGGEKNGNGNWHWVTQLLEERYKESPLTHERYDSAWVHLSLFFQEQGILSPTMLNRTHCLEYIAWRESPDRKQGKRRAGRNTALGDLRFLRLVMNEAVENEMVSGNPCLRLKIKANKSKIRPALTPEDCELIRTQIARRTGNEAEAHMLRVSFEIARHQGCRFWETRLDPFLDVDLDRKTIQFTAKRGRVFTTALHPKLIPLFQELRRDGRALTWDIPPHRVSSASARRWGSEAWSRFLHLIGLAQKGITFHSTRVTVITEMARAGVPITKTMNYVGHASPTIHAIYQRLVPEDVSGCTLAVG